MVATTLTHDAVFAHEGCWGAFSVYAAAGLVRAAFGLVKRTVYWYGRAQESLSALLLVVVSGVLPRKQDLAPRTILNPLPFIYFGRGEVACDVHGSPRWSNVHELEPSELYSVQTEADCRSCFAKRR